MIDRGSTTARTETDHNSTRKPLHAGMPCSESQPEISRFGVKKNIDDGMSVAATAATTSSIIYIVVQSPGLLVLVPGIVVDIEIHSPVHFFYTNKRYHRKRETIHHIQHTYEQK